MPETESRDGLGRAYAQSPINIRDKRREVTIDTMDEKHRKVVTGLWLLLGLIGLAALTVFGDPPASQ